MFSANVCIVSNNVFTKTKLLNLLCNTTLTVYCKIIPSTRSCNGSICEIDIDCCILLGRSCRSLGSDPKKKIWHSLLVSRWGQKSSKACHPYNLHIPE